MRNFSSKDEVKRFIFNCDYYEMSSLPDEYRLDPEIAEFVSKACPIKLFYLHKKLFSNKELILNGTRAAFIVWGISDKVFPVSFTTGFAPSSYNSGTSSFTSSIRYFKSTVIIISLISFYYILYITSDSCLK